MANSASTTAAGIQRGEASRRDFLYVATATVGVVGAVATLVPLVDQMNPDASTLAAGGPVDVDVSKIEEGAEIIVRWREHPIFVFHRSQQTLQALQSAQRVSLLADPNSEQMQQPPYAANWHRSVKPELGVVVGICTHLRLYPVILSRAERDIAGGRLAGGYFCPCHGSKYDAAGRVFSGVPVPYNLPVPPYHFVNDTTIRIGENPSDSGWKFASIRQL
jgi:ubiquinol-cytochrome c reductase iron-sulfur subunit